MPEGVIRTVGNPVLKVPSMFNHLFRSVYSSRFPLTYSLVALVALIHLSDDFCPCFPQGKWVFQGVCKHMYVWSVCQAGLYQIKVTTFYEINMCLFMYKLCVFWKFEYSIIIDCIIFLHMQCCWEFQRGYPIISCLWCTHMQRCSRGLRPVLALLYQLKLLLHLMRNGSYVH